MQKSDQRIVPPDETPTWLKDITPEPEATWSDQFARALARWYMAEKLRKRLTSKKRKM